MLSKEPSFEEIVARLEAIVARLEGGEVKLEESLALFEEGVGLSKRGGQRLDAAEKRLEVLLENNETAPLAEHDTDPAVG